MKYKPGQKIKFAEERQRYTIRACNERHLICTKPFNLYHTVIYTVVDLIEGIRGTETMFEGAETDGQCEYMLHRLFTAQTNISHRNRIPLKIESINRKLTRSQRRYQDYLDSELGAPNEFGEYIITGLYKDY